MGEELSSLFSKKKTKRHRKEQYSSRLAQKMHNAQRNGKLIYKPIPLASADKPKGSLRPNGQFIYEPIHIKSERDRQSPKYEDDEHPILLSSSNYYKIYDDGIFAVYSRQAANECTTFRI